MTPNAPAVSGPIGKPPPEGDGLYNGSLVKTVDTGETEEFGTVDFSQYFRASVGMYSFCRFSMLQLAPNGVNRAASSSRDMVVESAGAVTDNYAARPRTLLVFTDGQSQSGVLANNVVYVYTGKTAIEWVRDTLKFQISSAEGAGIAQFETGNSYSWSVMMEFDGEERTYFASIGTVTSIEKDGAGNCVFSGTLTGKDNVFQDGKRVQLYGYCESTGRSITYDLGKLEKNSGNPNQALVAGRSVASLEDFMDDGPEPYSSPADITGDGVVGAVDYVHFSEAWMSRWGDGNWDARCDLNGNGIVDAADFALFSQDWGWKAEGAGD